MSLTGMISLSTLILLRKNINYFIELIDEIAPDELQISSNSWCSSRKPQSFSEYKVSGGIYWLADWSNRHNRWYSVILALNNVSFGDSGRLWRHWIDSLLSMKGIIPIIALSICSAWWRRVLTHYGRCWCTCSVYSSKQAGYGKLLD